MARIFSLAPTFARAKAKLRGRKSIEEFCSERLVIAPGETSPRTQAIFLPDELDRVTGVRRPGDVDQVRAGTSIHLPTIAYRLRDATIADGAVYTRNGFENVSAQRRKPIIAGSAIEIDEAQLCGDISSDVFFGHWLLESLGKELLADERGMQSINMTNSLRVHESGYRNLLGMPGRIVTRARVRDLWLVDDRGYNSSHVERLAALRARLRDAVPGAGSGLVFMGRGRTGVKREMLNAAEIAEIVVKRGGVVIEPEAMAAADIAAALTGARIVVAVEGSAFAHAQLALAKGSALVIIQPPDRFNSIHKRLADLSGLHVGLAVGVARPGGFYLEPDRFSRLLGLVEASI